MNEKAGTQNPSHAETRFSRLRDVSTGRAVLWLEVAVGAMMLISIAIDGWEKSQIETFNAVFIFLLIAAVVLGLGLFIQKNLAMERRAALVTAMILAGCLMVAYSALMYESGDAIFILSAVPGAGLAIAGVGALVVRESIAGRLAGYYALWIFGLLVIMFMPLNELMALGYSSRDMLVGFFGFGISGVLLDRYCPAPEKFESPAAWEAAKVNAHYIWFVFVGIALLATLALIVYGQIIRRLDRAAENS